MCAQSLIANINSPSTTLFSWGCLEKHRKAPITHRVESNQTKDKILYNFVENGFFLKSNFIWMNLGLIVSEIFQNISVGLIL